MLQSLEYGQSIVIPISNQMKRKEQNQTDLRLCWLVGWLDGTEREKAKRIQIQMSMWQQASVWKAYDVLSLLSEVLEGERLFG